MNDILPTLLDESQFLVNITRGRFSPSYRTMEPEAGMIDEHDSMEVDRGGGGFEGESIVVAEFAENPWAFWPTVGFSAIIGIAGIIFVVPAVVIVAIVFKIKDPNFHIENLSETLTSNGLFMLLTTCLTAVPAVGLSVLFAKIRKNITVKRYLAFNRVSFKNMAKWLGILVLFVMCEGFLTTFLEKNESLGWMVDVYSSAAIMPFLLVSMIVIAPIAEEIAIRGFMYNGFQSSRVGARGAIILTAFVWACLHTQYDLYGMGCIFVLGLLLGYARYKTGSVLVPIAMHVLMNLMASVGVMIEIQGI